MTELIEKCIIVAELGINHNGDMDLARDAIKAAKHAGADAIKFQNYRTEDFLSDRSLAYTYLSQGKQVTEPQYDMFKRCELTDVQVGMLADYCREQGIMFFSTPTNEKGLALLKEVGASFVKNGSDYLTHLPLIRAMAKSGLPTILSTGMANLSEIDSAVREFGAAGGEKLILLHCTSSYPTAPEDVHLRKIPVLRDAFGCPVGLSDHTNGITAAIGASVLGACMIEKHFTLDKSLPGPDHSFSMDPAELRLLVDAIRTVQVQLGEGKLGPTVAEAINRKQYRLSCVTAKDLPAGHIITEMDIAFRRPGEGLAPEMAFLLIGRKIPEALPIGYVFSTGDIR